MRLSRTAAATRARSAASSGAGTETIRCSRATVVSKSLVEQRDELIERSGVGGDDVDALLADLRLQLRRRAGGDLAAVVDQHDAVGERVGLVEILRRQQQRDAVADQLADGRPDDLAAARVEAGRRLVEHEQLRAVDQAGGEVDAAALSAGEVLDQPVAELADVEALDELLDERVRRRGGGRAGAPSAAGSRAP